MSQMTTHDFDDTSPATSTNSQNNGNRPFLITHSTVYSLPQKLTEKLGFAVAPAVNGMSGLS